jgi:hypothetical protein
MRFLALFLLAFASPAAAQALQTPAEALAQDAAEYARQHHVEPDEALRRLQAQEETVAVTDRLRLAYAKRLAGIFIEHEPAYRIVVLLKGGKAVPDAAIEAAGMTVPIVFRTGAPATREKILKAIAKRGERLRAAFPDARGMGVDPRSGELVLMVGDSGKTAEDLAETAARASDIAGVPARVRAIEAAANLAAVEGGTRVEGADAVTGRHAVCTAGFVVTDGTRTGLVTAAHCPDVLTYVEPGGGKVELPFVGQWGWSFQDVQVNVAEGGEPLFYVDAKKSEARVPEGVRPRASTRAGDFVCHRGERTGYTCGEVELTDFAPPGDLCGGPCATSWVTVGGPGCGGGDSGGPVFAGDTAFGIMKGGTWTRDGRCAFYYYMSLDYLPEGWRLATRPDSPAAPEEEPRTTP